MGIAIRTIVGAAAALLIGGTIAYACAGGEDGPTWSIAKSGYDPAGAMGTLSPSNDTRVNLLLLAADRNPQALKLLASGKATGPFFSWGWSSDGKEAGPEATPAADPDDQPEDGYSRCQTNNDGRRAFIAAVTASLRLTPAEKRALTEGRRGLKPTCQPQGEGAAHPGLTSPAASEFVTYLEGAEDFYAGDFDAAATRFGRLAGASDAWLRETARYMVGRTHLNKAIDSGIDEYSYVDLAKVDRAAARAAGGGFTAYLAAYPTGRYAASAQGLMRRVHWLSGNSAALSRAYAGMMQSAAADPEQLFDEIDYKLFEPKGRPADPLLLAVWDLQRMRHDGDYSDACCDKPLTRAELEGQRAAFAGQEELFDYLRAAFAFHVEDKPRDVLAIIPDRARQAKFTYLQFSRQMLRGMALTAIGDRNARGFFNDLFAGATQPYQRAAVELALASEDERRGNLAAVFAPGSKVQNPAMREILLSRIAGPGLLRQQVRQAPNKRERDVALYVLLAKQLARGMYADWLTDVRMAPANASNENIFWVNESGEAVEQEAVPLGIFTRPNSLGDYGCGPLAQTVGALAQRPSAPRERLCLAEFFRSQGFDSWEYDEPLEPGGLGGTRSLFPGKPYSRLEVYKAVMADAAATPDDKAFALYRAVRCYEPTGNNSCGGTDVPLAQRRGWFNRLKATYPQSKWAKILRYYW